MYYYNLSHAKGNKTEVKTPQKSALSEISISPCVSKAYRIYHPILNQTCLMQVFQSVIQYRFMQVINEGKYNFASLINSSQNQPQHTTTLSTIIKTSISALIQQMSFSVGGAIRVGLICNSVINSAVAYHCNGLRIFEGRA